MSAPLRVLLVGPNGRMGRAVQAAAEKESGLTIAECVGRGQALAAALSRCEVVIDFSSAETTAEVCRDCAAQVKPLVLGTTGHRMEQTEAIKEAARTIPLVYAANFSVAVNVLFALTRQAASLLGASFDPAVVEMHHRTKKDAPSGTAKRIEQILQQASPREDEVSVAAIRAGDIVGEHTVLFSGPGERLELTHRSVSRENFAAGALRAARWVVRQPAGLYNMEDVLGL